MRYKIEQGKGGFVPTSVTLHLTTEAEYRYFTDNVIPGLLTNAIFNENHRLLRDLESVVRGEADSIEGGITLRNVS